MLRQKGSTLVYLPTTGTWMALEEMVIAPGQSRWHHDILLTGQYRHRCHLLAHREPEEDKPWLLATSYPIWRRMLRAYRRT